MTRRLSDRLPFSSSLRRGSLALALATAAVLSACGGGGGAITAFAPKQIAALGDELSLFTTGGKAWTINAVNATTKALDCTATVLWTRHVVADFGQHFAECPGSATTPSTVINAAQVGSDAAALAAQVDATLAARSAADSSLLALIWGGTADILAVQNGRAAYGNDTAVLAEARRRGALVATQVARLVAADVRVIVATAPDLSLSPWAKAQGATGVTQVKAIVNAYNDGLRLGIHGLYGRDVGLVLADEIMQAMATLPSNFGLTNTDTAVCTTALPDCTSETLVAKATTVSALWADDTHVSPAVHSRVGTDALAKARGLPF